MIGWNDSYALGVPHIDAQHKQLFGIIGDLHQAMLKGQSKLIVGEILAKLIDYTKRHFSAEETMLRSKNYSDLSRHQVIHHEFTAKIESMHKQHQAGSTLLTVDLMDFLQKWLAGHVLGTDVNYVRELHMDQLSARAS